jgi:DNA helicase-2/ATP-dependent DNA helicase PcrA
MIDLITFHTCLAQQSARGYDLDSKQKEAVEYSGGPLWLLAGPGSGKSEVLVTRTLKLLCVNGVAPRSIALTTFTKPAAQNLEDRLSSYLSVLQAFDSSLKNVDLSDIRIGTLHSLCNDILQEYRYPPYQNVRLLDKVEQDLFTYRTADISEYKNLDFWRYFHHAVPKWHQNAKFSPSKWKRVKAAVVLFNHIVDDCIDLTKMLQAGGHWATLVKFYQQYIEALQDNYRCDFAHLQARFLEFLTSSGGKRFLDGDGLNQVPLQHVLVDEYQDTNPIQERIYLALSHKQPHNITVVGDDDQALYRFRGANVACMVNFDKACQTTFAKTPYPIQLKRNYRSHSRIVDFFNNYITSFSEMAAPGVRAPGKDLVEPASSIQGNYPAVTWLTRKKAEDLPEAVVQLIRDHLVADNVIADLSQCVLLLRSTQDSPGNAGPFITAFKENNIPIYNPRSKSFMESEEVQCLLAALVEIIDKKHSFASYKDQKGESRLWVKPIQDWLNTLRSVLNDPTIPTALLEDYICSSNVELPKICAASTQTFIGLNLLEIIYRILSREPFSLWRQDPSRNLRLSKVTRLFEGYHSMSLDSLRRNKSGIDVDPTFLYRFYDMFVSYLIETGIDDDEDEDVIVPQGYLPIMTIHQAKGLEFPFVLVAQLGDSGRIGSAQILETDLANFRQGLYPRNVRDPELLVIEDTIRLLYVAYSRAKNGLILVATPDQVNSKKNLKRVPVPGRDHVEFRRNTVAI